jgi:glutamate-1-semialdehyde 2,1-aminomutase
MPLNISKSNILKLKGKSLLPSLSQTFSKSPTSFVEGVYPIYAERAEGSCIYDVDDNKYIDYLMALGPIVLGYNYTSINDAIKLQLNKGIIFSLPHPNEVIAAEAIKKVVPCAEMTRYTKTGSDAVTGAVRAARAITKRNVILYCGSGGVWDDWYSIVTSRSQGIPQFNMELIKIFDYNNSNRLTNLFQQYKNQVAAVIMEPTVYDLPQNNFLQEVKKITHENESLLIYDEILTGFRLSKGGGQEYFGVEPDMATFGKGIANGMPLGAIVGKSEYMESFEQVFVSTTFGGEALSLAACIATLEEYEAHDVCGHMWRMGRMIKEGFNKIAKEKDLNAECIGLPPRMKLLIRDDTQNDSLLYKSLFLQELIENGIFMHPNTILLCYSHSKEDIEFTLDAMDHSLSVLKHAIDNNQVRSLLRGQVAKEVIRRVVS